ncbi:hypothetical protein SRABI106_02872 [Rahnella aquatilis]|nr:hypothetical protein SRABI106_02872 [Rahnella aquatilis]
MKDDFIDGGTDATLLVLAAHHGFQQEALLADVFTLQNVIELLQSVIRIQIGKKAKITPVDADDFYVIAGQNARRTQHIAVTADDHG